MVTEFGRLTLHANQEIFAQIKKSFFIIMDDLYTRDVLRRSFDAVPYSVVR